MQFAPINTTRTACREIRNIMTRPLYILTIEPYNFSVKDTICYSGSSQRIRVHIPYLFSMYHSSDGSGDIENRQGI